MQFFASDEYLTTQVLTGTPQKLQLMLVEGALRSSKRAEGFLTAGVIDAANDALLHAQRIMGRLIGNLNYLEQPQLAGQMAAVYAFIYKSLVIALLRRDMARLADAIRVLQVERETWRLACEKFGSRLPGLVPTGGPPAPHHLHREHAPQEPEYDDAAGDAGGISFQA